MRKSKAQQSYTEDSKSSLKLNNKQVLELDDDFQELDVDFLKRSQREISTSTNKSKTTKSKKQNTKETISAISTYLTQTTRPSQPKRSLLEVLSQSSRSIQPTQQNTILPSPIITQQSNEPPTSSSKLVRVTSKTSDEFSKKHLKEYNTKAQKRQLTESGDFIPSKSQDSDGGSKILGSKPTISPPRKKSITKTKVDQKPTRTRLKRDHECVDTSTCNSKPTKRLRKATSFIDLSQDDDIFSSNPSSQAKSQDDAIIFDQKEEQKENPIQEVALKVEDEPPVLSTTKMRASDGMSKELLHFWLANSSPSTIYNKTASIKAALVNPQEDEERKLMEILDKVEGVLLEELNKSNEYPSLLVNKQPVEELQLTSPPTITSSSLPAFAEGKLEHPAILSVKDVNSSVEAPIQENRIPVNDLSASFSLDFDDEEIVLSAESLRSLKEIEDSYQQKSNTEISPIPSTQTKYHRFLVLNVTTPVREGKGWQQAKILHAFDDKTGREHTIWLIDDWYFTKVKSGDYINIIGKIDSKENEHKVDGSGKLMIILHPETLVSGKVVGESYTCLRRIILNERLKLGGGINSPIIYGEMLHQLFQNGLRVNDFSSETLNKSIENIIAANIEQLYAIGETDKTARKHMKSFTSALREWSINFLKSHPSRESGVKFDTNPGPPTKISVSKVLAVEEKITSPMYGLKGVVDVSIEVKIERETKTETVVIPLEVKTGKESGSISHKAQVMLYAMLMAEYYGIDIKSGLLYYMKGNKTSGVTVSEPELMALLSRRNEIAYYLENDRRLPPTLVGKQALCEKCPQLQTCTLYHKGFESGTEESSGMGDLFTKVTQHLTQSHLDYFTTWEKLIDLEKNESKRFRKEMWTLSSEEREKTGRCFSKMILVKETADTNLERYEYTFRKSSTPNKEGEEGSLFKLTDFSMCVGDFVQISTEQGQLGLGSGCIKRITDDSVSIECDEELKSPPLLSQNAPALSSCSQHFQGIMEIESLGNVKIRNKVSSLSESGNMNNDDSVPAFLWRIDKDELISGMSQVKGNLVHLFMSDAANTRRRKLIVDLEPPRFRLETESLSQLSKRTPSQKTPSSQKLNFSLNSDQRHATQKVLSALDYALILGMPGTGKTTTIAYIIHLLIERGKTILLTSYTHTAVDNLLLKLDELGIDFLRLGRQQNVHPALVKYTTNYHSFRTTEALTDFLKTKQVVATTCLGINHPLFQQKKFDYCIVDEASQITQPVCLGPIRFADCFILVGDHYQLPPLIKNEEAKDNGMDVSLFRRLSEAHPQAVANLEYQYRMNKDIMLLSNTLVYNHRLRCGTEAVADKSLLIDPNLLPKPLDPTFTDWLRPLLDPSCHVAFLNTDIVPALDSRVGETVKNETEAALVKQIVTALMLCGTMPSAIGVISPYRSQLQIIRNELGPYFSSSVEVHTVDKFQGKDKDCIIISLVRSNAQQNIGDLLRDWRRINVAFTRAKKKLLIIGSKATIENHHMFLLFMELMKENNWVHELPEKAHLLYSLVDLVKEPPESFLGWIKEQEKCIKKSPKKKKNSTPEPIAKSHSILRNVRDSFG